MTEKEILELLLAKVNEQGEILKDHSEILKSNGELLKEQGKILKDHSEILKSYGEVLKDHGDTLKSHSEILKEHSEILQAIKHGQEIQKAEIDRLNLTVAQIQGDQAEIKEIVHNMAGDISFLIRKATQHDDDLRELKRVK